jgi:hypothetical protein
VLSWKLEEIWDMSYGDSYGVSDLWVFGLVLVNDISLFGLVIQDLLGDRIKLEVSENNNDLKFFQNGLNDFACYKVEIIVEILSSRLWWRNLSLRWSLPVVGGEKIRK